MSSLPQSKDNFNSRDCDICGVSIGERDLPQCYELDEQGLVIEDGMIVCLNCRSAATSNPADFMDQDNFNSREGCGAYCTCKLCEFERYQEYARATHAHHPDCQCSECVSGSESMPWEYVANPSEY